MNDNWIVRVGRPEDYEGYSYCLDNYAAAYTKDVYAARRMDEDAARKLAAMITRGKAIMDAHTLPPGAMQHHSSLALSHLRRAKIELEKAQSSLRNSVATIVLYSLKECDAAHLQLVELEERVKTMAELDI